MEKGCFVMKISIKEKCICCQIAEISINSYVIFNDMLSLYNMICYLLKMEIHRFAY